MEKIKISSKQLALLETIYSFNFGEGVPPTLTELRKVLNVKSNQGILDLLGRLESKKLISRSQGKSRNIQITQLGKNYLGVPDSTSVRGGNDLYRPTETQIKILEKLGKIDRKLQDTYFGSIYVLNDDKNPERVAQSAHSLREVFAMLSRDDSLLSKEEKELAKKEKNSFARKLEKLFDPLGGVKMMKGATVYDNWNKKYQEFFTAVCHHGKVVKEEDYANKLHEYEEFLLRFVFPFQVEIYQTLDDLIFKGASTVNVTDLKYLISRNLESYRYFFAKIDETWFPLLSKEKMFFSSPVVSSYLGRIASKIPKDVVQVFKGMAVSGNYHIARDIIDATKYIPKEFRKGILEKIQKEHWLEHITNNWLGYPLLELLQHCLNERDFDSGLWISRLALSIKKPTKVDVKEYGHRRMKANIEEYEYSRFLDEVAKIPPAELFPFINILNDSLIQGIEFWIGDKAKTEDHSLGWRSAIEPSSQNWGFGDIENALVSCLRDCLENYLVFIEKKGGNLKEKLIELLPESPAYPIFIRMKIHLYRKFKHHFWPEINEAVIDYFPDRKGKNLDLWHEYMLLVKETFSGVKRETRDGYFAIVAGGLPKKDKKYEDHWKFKKYAIVADYLGKKEKTVYEDLKKRFGEAKEDVLLYLSYHTSWSGPTSALSSAELEKMTNLELVDYLSNWQPESSFMAPSRSGLGRELQNLVTEKAEFYSDQIAIFLDDRIRPVYLYHVFLGLENGLKKSSKINWESIIKLLRKLVEKKVAGSLPDFVLNKEDLESGWNEAFKWGLNLLSVGMNAGISEIAFTNRDDIWFILYHFAANSRPSEEEERKHLGAKLGLHHESINTLNGVTFHALYAYVFWCDRFIKNKDDRLVPEVKPLIEASIFGEGLNLLERSVHGYYFPWIFLYDHEWASKLVHDLFPEDNFEKWIAAWQTFLYRPVFEQVYQAMIEKYEFAMSQLRKKEFSQEHFKEISRRTGEQIILGYIHDFDTVEHPLYQKFFELTLGDVKAKVISFVGRAYVHSNKKEEIRPQQIKRIQSFWEWRLKSTLSPEELAEFGWFVKKDFFNNEWMLKMFIKVLEKTKGITEADHFVFENLDQLAVEFPELIGRALELIIYSKDRQRSFLFSRGETRSILKKLYESKSKPARAKAEELIDYLTKLGFTEYASIIEQPAICG